MTAWTSDELLARASITIGREGITAIEPIADPARIRELDLVIPDA